MYQDKKKCIALLKPIKNHIALPDIKKLSKNKYSHFKKYNTNPGRNLPRIDQNSHEMRKYSRYVTTFSKGFRPSKILKMVKKFRNQMKSIKNQGNSNTSRANKRDQSRALINRKDSICKEIDFSSFRPFSEFRKKYSIIKLLGKGTTSNVYLCRHRESKDYFAVKVIPIQSLATPLHMRAFKVITILPRNTRTKYSACKQCPRSESASIWSKCTATRTATSWWCPSPETPISPSFSSNTLR